MPNGCCILLSKKKEAILTVIPGCECWHCQEPRAGWRRGSEKELEKSTFHSGDHRGKGTQRKDQAMLVGLGMISRLFWPPFLRHFCPFFSSQQGETSKSPLPWKGKIDLNSQKCRWNGTAGFLGELTSPMNPYSLLVWYLRLGAKQRDVETSNFQSKWIQCHNGTPGGIGLCHLIHSPGLSQGLAPFSPYKCLLNEMGVDWLIDWLCPRG